MGTFSTIGTYRTEVKMFESELMAVSAIELPDTMQGYGNNLAYYHQPEEGNPAFNLDNRELTHYVDNSVPSYNVDYSVPSYYEGSQPQLSDGLSSWWPTKPLDAPSPPTLVSSRPHYSSEIKADSFSQRIKEQGHKILKRSPLIPPFDPITKGVIKALPPVYKGWKATTGPLYFGACNFGFKLGIKLTLGLGAPAAVLKKF